MSILEEIRPRADHLTNEHSDALLREVINCPAARPRRWWRSKLAAFGLVGVVVAGGTAYAGGLVPSIVSERFDQMTAGDDAWPDPIYDVHLLVETTLSDGTPIRIWRAKTTDGVCQIADTTGIQERPEDFGVGCARWNFGEGPGLDGGVLQACDHHPALVYGELRPPWRGIRVVRVKAQGTEADLAVTGARHVFFGEIPGGTEGDRIVLQYFDDEGNVLGTQHRTYSVDSDTESCP